MGPKVRQSGLVALRQIPALQEDGPSSLVPAGARPVNICLGERWAERLLIAPEASEEITLITVDAGASRSKPEPSVWKKNK